MLEVMEIWKLGNVKGKETIVKDFNSQGGRTGW